MYYGFVPYRLRYQHSNSSNQCKWRAMRDIEHNHMMRRIGIGIYEVMFPFLRLSWPLKLDWRTLWTIKTVNIMILVLVEHLISFLHISCYLHIYAFSLEYSIVRIIWSFNVNNLKVSPKKCLELERRKKDDEIITTRRRRRRKGGRKGHGFVMST